MDTSFAFLDEVWSPEQNCQPIAQDDIMSAFIDNNEKKCYPPNDLKSSAETQFVLPRGSATDIIEGYDTNDFYMFDDYFVNDISSMKANQADEQKKIIEQEEMINDEEAYNIIEDYEQQPVPEVRNVVDNILTEPTTLDKPFITSEVIIVLLCGIILVLLFDKFLSLSIRLRK